MCSSYIDDLQGLDLLQYPGGFLNCAHMSD